MANKPTFYDIEDYETGKRYKVEAYDADTTYDEAVDFFSSVPEEERAQYEYNPTPVKTKEGSAETPVPVEPSPVSTTQTTVPTVAPRAEDYEFGMDKLFDFSPESKSLSNVDQRQLLALVNNPNVTREQVNTFLGARGRQYGDAEWSQIEAQRERGRGFGAVASDTVFEGMVDEEALQEEYVPESDGFFSQVGRSMLEGWSDPASLMNALDRGKLDFFDVYRDKVAEQFPDATPEQLDELEDQFIGYMARKRSQAATEGVADDSFAPWLIGQFLAIEPYDAIPIGRAARAGTRAGRAAESAATGAGVAVVGDVAGQGLAMADNAQDEFDPVRTAVSAGLSAGLGGAGQAAGDLIGDAVRRRQPQAPVEFEPIVVPTARKGSKKYREELDNTTVALNDHITRVTESWTNPPPIETLPTFKDVDGVDNDALGVYREDGTVQLNTEALAKEAKKRGVSVEDMATSVTFHEALGHNALDVEFREELDSVLDTFYEQGADGFRSLVDEWIETHPSAYLPTRKNKNALTPEELYNQRVRATEEVLAEWAENEGVLPAKFVDKIVNVIKNYARRAGVNLRYSEREIKAILGVAQRRVTSGAPDGSFTPGGVDRYKIVYHGSGTDFDKFDHSYMGSGEGQQVFGWGTYLTDEKGIAQSYKDRFGTKTYTWKGIEPATFYDLRDMARRSVSPMLDDIADALEARLDAEVHMPSIVDYAISEITQDGKLSDSFAKDYYDDAGNIWDRKGWSEEGQKIFSDTIEPLLKELREGFKVSSTGKLYEVDIPDDAKWLEWEEPIKDQPELASILKELGVEVVDDDTYRKIQTDYAKIKTEYDRALASFEDADFDKVKELNPEFLRLKRLAQNTMSELSEGQDAYSIISDRVKSDKEASILLSDSGFTGNRYLANNLRSSAPRKGKGDKFNYVVFDDNTPKIVNKYMKPEDSQANDPFYGGSETTTSAGFRRPAVDDRFARKDRIERRKTKLENDNYDPALERRAKYARPTPDESIPLEDDDLFNIRNAKDITDSLLEGYESPGPISWDQAKREAGLRALPSSYYNKATGIEDLSVKLYKYDNLSDKMNDKLVGLYARMQTEGPSPAIKSEYLKTMFRYQELVGRIFDAQSEVGRALNVLKNLNLTRRKAMELNEVLKTYESGGDPLGGFASDDNFKEFAERIQYMLASGNPQGANTMVRNTLNPYWWQYILTARHASMLSGMGTHVKNAMDGAMMIARELEETILSVPGYYARKGLQAAGKNVKDGVSPQEAGARMYGLLRAMIDGGTYMSTYKAFMEGHQSRQYSAKIEMQDARIWGVSKVNDALYASDIFFRNFHTNANLYSLGVRSAIADGFKGVRAFEEGTSRALNPSKELVEQALKLTDTALLVDSPSKLSSWAEAAKAIRPGMTAGEQAASFVANMLFPFLRVTDRLLFQELRRSPLSVLDKNTRQDWELGGAARDIAIARTLYGSALIAYYWNAAGTGDDQEGDLEGQGPLDYRKQQSLEATGYRPNSVVEDGKMVDATALNLSFAPWDTQNNIATHVASIREGWERGYSSEQDVAAGIAEAIRGSLVILTSQSYAENMAMYVEPLTQRDPTLQDVALASFGGSVASQFVPAALRQVNQQVIDPIKRDTRGDGSVVDRIYGRVITGIPGLSETLPARRDFLGDTIPQGRSTFGTENYTPLKADEVSKELRAIDRAIDEPLLSGVKKSFQYEGEKIELTSEQQQQWTSYKGYYIKEGMKIALVDPEWKTLKTEDKVAVIKQLQEDAYDAAKVYMLQELGLEQQ